MRRKLPPGTRHHESWCAIFFGEPCGGDSQQPDGWLSRHIPFPDSYRPGERDPVSDSGPIFEAQIGSQFSALGSHCRIPGVY